MKKILIIIGIISFIAGGIIGIIYQVNSATTLPLSKIVPLSAELETKSEMGKINWAEYKIIISKYQDKIAEIKKNCSLDKRCENGKVILGALKDKKDFVKVMNFWLRTSNLNYAK